MPVLVKLCKKLTLPCSCCPVFDFAQSRSRAVAQSRSKQATEYLQHSPIGSLSFGSVWTGDIANTLFGDIANS